LILDLDEVLSTPDIRRRCLRCGWAGRGRSSWLGSKAQSSRRTDSVHDLAAITTHVTHSQLQSVQDLPGRGNLRSGNFLTHIFYVQRN